MRRGRNRHHKRRNDQYRWTNRRQNSNNFNSYSDTNTRSLNKPSEKKEVVKSSFFSKIPFRYKLLIGILIINFIAYLFINLILFFSLIFSIIILLDIIFISAWIVGWTKTCPKCNSYWAKKLVDRTDLGSHIEFVDTTKTTYYRDKNGNVIGTSSGRDTKPVTKYTIQNHWICKYCNHSWSGRIHDV